MNSTEKKNHQNKSIVFLNLSGSYKGGLRGDTYPYLNIFNKSLGTITSFY